MKALAVLASAVALVGMAIPAHADGDDDAFLAALTKAGVTYKNPARAVKAGQKVCDLANAGVSELEIIRDIQEFNPAFTAAAAARFVQAAASVYCPDKLSVDSGGANPNSSS